MASIAPKNRISRTRRDKKRASAWKLEAPTIVLCPNCKQYKRPHRLCGSCGFYNGRQVVKVAED